MSDISLQISDLISAIDGQPTQEKRNLATSLLSVALSDFVRYGTPAIAPIPTGEPEISFRNMRDRVIKKHRESIGWRYELLEKALNNIDAAIREAKKGPSDE